MKNEKGGFWIANTKHIAIWFIKGMLFFVTQRFVAKMTKAATKFVWSFKRQRSLTHREINEFISENAPQSA